MFDRLKTVANELNNEPFSFLSDDVRKNRVPPEFPGDILVDFDENENKNHLQEMYRKWVTPPPQFVYFMERIMPAIAPYRSEFHKNKGIKDIGEMYSVSDEAFGLVMLLNELHIWEDIAKKEKIGYRRKRFVDRHSRSKKGWSTRGINTYNRIYMHLSIRQKEDCSTELKAAMKKRYMDAERHEE